MEAYVARRRKKNGKNKILVAFVFLLIIASGIILYKFYEKIEVEELDKGSEAVRTLRTLDEEKEEQKEVVDVIAQATSSVVGISKVKNIGSTIFLKDGSSKLGLGTGLIVTDNGYILTNAHVSGEKYSTCYVTLETGEVFTGNVVWSDMDVDLAILKISAKNLIYAKLGDSDNIKVGEKVYAIGNPIGFEFERTVTSGIISAIDRTIKIEEDENSYMSNLIQTDATINLGNSGGPLINIDGEVVGINTLKITSAEGISFAVPINLVKTIIEKFATQGKFEEASIGIFAYDKNVIPYIDNNLKFNTGIYVVQIDRNSSAYNSGLREKDVIIQIDNINLKKMCDLRRYIYTKNIGDEVILKILRNNTEKEIKMTLIKK
ncbi:peptidase S1 and S6 chymotrypsin/Hap [Clostridium sp. CAG:798]|mgnify:FL=1|jgi:serine protease Do|nr:peptidase S1 and S6 chymotrypsin/Hap [Clostridium sp. CAG:798]HBJ12600.1 serine protease [Clostridiales bacterium]